jgi:hypothetical protein
LLADVGERTGRQYYVAVFDLVGDVTHAERVRASEVGRVAGTTTVRYDGDGDGDYDYDSGGGGRGTASGLGRYNGVGGEYARRR